MKLPNLRLVGLVCLSFALLTGAEAQPVASAANPTYTARIRNWLDTPWKVRYLIRISRVMPWRHRLDTSYDVEKEQKGDPGYRHYLPYFTPTYLLPLTEKNLRDLQRGFQVDARLGFTVIEFDREGRVITPNSSPLPLVGKTGMGYDGGTGETFRRIYLVEGDAKPGRNWSLVANWFEGFRSGAGSEVSPALCDFYLDDDRYQAQANPLRAEKYDVGKVEDEKGLTGCREWAWQRNRGIQAQPYIDASSYPSLAMIKETKVDRPFLAEVLGWGGFDEPVRPVIGMYDGKWLCLHDCPDGEAPGLIDIQAWTAKRGWPLPQRLPFFSDGKLRGGRVQ